MAGIVMAVGKKFKDFTTAVQDCELSGRVLSTVNEETALAVGKAHVTEHRHAFRRTVAGQRSVAEILFPKSAAQGNRPGGQNREASCRRAGTYSEHPKPEGA